METNNSQVLISDVIDMLLMCDNYIAHVKKQNEALSKIEPAVREYNAKAKADARWWQTPKTLGEGWFDDCGERTIEYNEGFINDTKQTIEVLSHATVKENDVWLDMNLYHRIISNRCQSYNAWIKLGQHQDIVEGLGLESI